MKNEVGADSLQPEKRWPRAVSNTGNHYIILVITSLYVIVSKLLCVLIVFSVIGIFFPLKGQTAEKSNFDK